MRGFETMMDKMNQVAKEVEKGLHVEYGDYTPRVDIAEDEKNVFVHVELPGVAKEDVKVSINEENLLTIKGAKKRSEGSEKERTFLRAERRYGEFTRTFILPENVKKDAVNASFDNGVLTVVLEKIEPVKPKEVEISIS